MAQATVSRFPAGSWVKHLAWHRARWVVNHVVCSSELFSEDDFNSLVAFRRGTAPDHRGAGWHVLRVAAPMHRGAERAAPRAFGGGPAAQSLQPRDRRFVHRSGSHDADTDAKGAPFAARRGWKRDECSQENGHRSPHAGILGVCDRDRHSTKVALDGPSVGCARGRYSEREDSPKTRIARSGAPTGGRTNTPHGLARVVDSDQARRDPGGQNSWEAATTTQPLTTSRCRHAPAGNHEYPGGHHRAR